MKNTIRKIAPATAVLMSLTGLAQPVLTASDVTPVVGEVFNYNYTNYVDPGLSGSNQTWNLSTMTIQSTGQKTVFPSSGTPHYSNFSTSNICLVSTDYYEYFLASSTGYQSLGSYYSTGPAVSYNPPKDILHFPFNYNTTYTTSYQSLSPGPNTTSVNGVITITYDGYGNLILPGGTYSGVVRIHYEDISYQVQGTATLSTNEMDSYSWYFTGTHMPLATVTNYTSTTANTFSTGNYLKALTTGIQNYDHEKSRLILISDPIEHTLTIKTANGSRVKETALVSLSGEILLTQTVIPSSEQVLINMRNFAKGIYIVKVRSTDGSEWQDKIVIQ